MKIKVINKSYDELLKMQEMKRERILPQRNKRDKENTDEDAIAVFVFRSDVSWTECLRRQ